MLSTAATQTQLPDTVDDSSSGNRSMPPQNANARVNITHVEIGTGRSGLSFVLNFPEPAGTAYPAFFCGYFTRHPTALTPFLSLRGEAVSSVRRHIRPVAGDEEQRKRQCYPVMHFDSETKTKFWACFSRTISLDVCTTL